jgi:isochorismate synthase
MPRKESLKLIRMLEKHNREYYAGFLGPVGINNQLTLFVNLRCMKVLADRLALFVGGGITADSVPEEEWMETEIKAETLLTVIRQIEP